MKQPSRSYILNFLATTILLFIIVSCSNALPADQQTQTSNNNLPGRLNVIATTTIVGDIVRAVAGDQVNLHVLVPAGMDEHTYQYTPDDVAKVADAQIIFMNGGGLETFMEPLLKNAGEGAKVVSVSDGIKLLQGKNADHIEDSATAGGDPHVWTNPQNVKVWTKNIVTALSELDPDHMADYQANAKKYNQSLDELDAWIQQQTDRVPPANRLLISDHQVFTYFADRYGFKLVGALIPSYSTSAEPTAQELAALEDAIRQFGVKAIFVGSNLNPSLAERVAADTGVNLVQVYTGSLTVGPPAATYLDYMKYDINQIVRALR